MVARGEAELAVQMLSELIGVPGIQVAGELPASLAPPILFSAGLGRAVLDAGVAAAFVAFLRTPEALAILARHGLAPP